MLLPTPLVRGTLVKRYKRFLADVVLDSGETVTAHCANSGAMTGVAPPGAEVWLSESDKPGRKLRYSWELARIDGTLVGINTQHPNRLAAEAIAAGGIPELAGYATIRREVKYGKASRIDLLLEGPGLPTCYVEVKNVHLRIGELAAFPDAVTARGAKHLLELTDMVRAGFRAVMLYLVQREDCIGFRPAEEVDPVYAAGLRQALAAGVEAYCHGCRLTLDGITVGDRLPIRVDGLQEVG